MASCHCVVRYKDFCSFLSSFTPIPTYRQNNANDGLRN